MITIKWNLHPRVEGIFPKTCKKNNKVFAWDFFPNEGFLIWLKFLIFIPNFFLHFYFQCTRCTSTHSFCNVHLNFDLEFFFFCNFQVKICGDFIVKVNKVQKATNENRLSTDHHLNGIITLWYSHFTAGTTANTELHLIYFVSEDIRSPNGNQCISSKLVYVWSGNM